MIKRILVGLAGTTYTPVAIERAITLAHVKTHSRGPGRHGPRSLFEFDLIRASLKPEPTRTFPSPRKERRLIWNVRTCRSTSGR